VVSSTILAQFATPEAAAAALHALSESGIQKKQLTVFSRVPLPEGALDVDTTRVRVPWIALAAAVIGAAIGFTLAAGTMWLYKLPTGGKPILAGPPILIITYEITMLTVLITTFLAVLWETRLPEWRKRPYDPSLPGDAIGLGVEPGNLAVSHVETMLREAGAEKVTVQEAGPA